MGDFLSKISSYNLFNYLFPGALFVYFGERLGFLELPDANFVASFFLYYFAGMVVSRIGSLVIEPLFKKFSIVRYAPYSAYLKACASDEKIETLLEANNTYRTMISLFLCLGLGYLLWLVSTSYGLSKTTTNTALIFGGLAIFVFSYRKQTSYVRMRVEAAAPKKAAE